MRDLVQRVLRNMFGMDWRSLALLRIGLALVLLCDLFVSGCNLRALYTDEGVMPRSYLIPSDDPLLGLHFLSGSVWFEAALFALEGLMALLMLVGYRTKFATIGAWVLLLSRQARNPLLLFGSDMTLHIAFFWAMFLPLNRRFSMDVALGRVQPVTEPVYSGIAGFAYILQFMLIYIISGILKTGSTWRVDHTAVYYALAIEMYGRPFGHWLNQFDWLTEWMTVFTLYLELYGPLLFILPIWSGWARLLGVVVFAALQIGFGVCMQMGLFGVIMTVMSFVFLPKEFWKYFAEPMGHGMSSIAKKPGPLSALMQRVEEWIKRRKTDAALVHAKSGLWHWCASCLRLCRAAVVIFFMVYMLVWNIDTIPGQKVLMPPKLGWIGPDTGLDQRFDMFAPDPQTFDGWFVIVGELQNGRSIDAFNGTSTLSLTKPASVADTYRDQRWGSYLLDLLDPDCAIFLEPFAQYLAGEWNKNHSDGEQIKAIRIIFMSETTGPNHTKLPVEARLLWTEDF